MIDVYTVFSPSSRERRSPNSSKAIVASWRLGSVISNKVECPSEGQGCTLWGELEGAVPPLTEDSTMEEGYFSIMGVRTNHREKSALVEKRGHGN